MHLVAVLALPNCITFDLTSACETFARARELTGAPAYEVRVCSSERSVKSEFFSISAPYRLRTLARADTIIVPGTNDIERPLDETVATAVARAFSRGTRVASICTGAFALAQLGLLDGKRATTHWLAADALAERYPRVSVDASAIYVDEGDVLTSAGAAAGLDLCLHMIRSDFGAEVASQTARVSVMPLERTGDQAQFIVPPKPNQVEVLEPLLRWLEAHLERSITVEEMASRVGMSGRSFSRNFRRQIGTTPLQWLLVARTRRAQALLESTSESIERIAESVGFGSAAAFRSRFRRVVGTSPRAYRSAFRSHSAMSNGAPPSREIGSR